MKDWVEEIYLLEPCKKSMYLWVLHIFSSFFFAYFHISIKNIGSIL